MKSDLLNLLNFKALTKRGAGFEKIVVNGDLTFEFPNH